MSAYSESTLAARFAALAPETIEGNWLDVQRRARRHGRRRMLVFAAAAAFAAIVVGSAVGLGPRALDFVSATPAPPKTVEVFDRSLAIQRFFDGKSQILTDVPRTIIDRGSSAGRVYLAVAPTRDAGFCWATDIGGAGKDLAAQCLTRAHLQRDPLYVGGYGTAWVDAAAGVEAGYGDFAGYIAQPGTATLQARYEDGTTEAIPYTWVSKPIAAGFFVFDPPQSHRAGPGTRIVEIAALDAHGRRLARERLKYSSAQERATTNYWNVPVCCNQTHVFPPAADVAMVQPVEFPDLPAWAPSILVAPAGERGFCWAVVSKQVVVAKPEYEVAPGREGVFGSCSRSAGFDPGWGLQTAVPPFGIREAPDGNSGPLLVWLFGSVESGVARVELGFQDGARASVEPRSRLVAYVIPRAHWARGHRLQNVRLVDTRGREVRRFAFDMKLSSYPCKKPVDFGAGVEFCR